MHLHITWNQSSKKLALSWFSGGSPPPPRHTQLGHRHNSASSANSRWLERCKLQAHAQQKEKELGREGGFTLLSPCLGRCFTRTHTAPYPPLPPPLPRLSDVTFTLCANLAHFRAEGGVQKKKKEKTQ